MKHILYLLLAILAMTNQATRAATLDWPAYQRPDGAITTYIGGNSIDPYFATKALLAANDVGLDTEAASGRWIAWLSHKQRGDGRFDRYCLSNERFDACKVADADDAMMATWLELLVRAAPPDGMPPAWKTSFDKADRYLETLRDKRLGVYNISRELPVALLMDNVEISSAFKAVSRYLSRHHDETGARAWTRKAEALDHAIVRVFWQPPNGFVASTQARESADFYPDKVAQIFPILASIHPERHAPTQLYSDWMQSNRFAWLQMPETDFPWGLVALIADRMGDQDAITCWRARSIQFRHGSHWNVLEEALYLAFDARLTREQALAPIPAGVRCR